jgi:peptidoglycan/xylan/chitin deacetylase (PgdA/CDA1 family)
MVLVSFDDGDLSNLEVALPILQELGLGAVFFVTRQFVGQRGMVSASSLRELADAGMVIGSHGATHRFLNTLTPLALILELSTSRDFLQQMTGREVTLLSLPGGRGGLRECQAARAVGYHSVLGSRPGDNRFTRAGECIDRVAITRNTGRRAFAQILNWRGPAVQGIRLRHQLMQLPKKVLGDRGFDRLRRVWVRH